MEPQPAQAAQSGLTAALDRLWARFLPEIRERAAVIESAIQSLKAGSLDEEQRQVAASAAHKLAGVLGTFNLHQGTELARRLEVQFTGTPESAAELESLSSELRRIIDSRP